MKVRLEGLVQAAMLVLALATLLGFAGGISWFFDLFSHFRVQYFLAALALGAVLFARKSLLFGTTAMIVAVANLLLLLPLFWGGTGASSSSPTGTAMLYNVNTQTGSPAAVAELIEEIDPDLLVLEEVDSRWIEEISETTRRYPHQILEPRADNFGIGLWSKFPVTDSEVVFLGSAEVPTILATVATNQGEIQVVGTHPLPPIGSRNSKMRDEQLALLPETLSDTVPVLLLGDLNTTPWGHSFRALLRESGLRNSMNGFGVQTTWPTGNWFLRIPLDHVLHSPEIQIDDRRVGSDGGSDHLPVIIQFSILEDT
ncbi:MAG: endonuclease/exonuclease/phosphatase family protein [Verrucomicrobiales bacterium]|nr:endonuclease/exonuclease/phosphatase family protein [Verrucomicrobiales bacterium]